MPPTQGGSTNTEPLVFIGVCDWAGLVRGKAVPHAMIDLRRRKGVGYTHSNIMMSPFGPILTTPFGTRGDLIIRPDPHLRVEVPFADGTVERFELGNIVNTDGTPWDLCPRTFLGRALDALSRLGLQIRAGFEQEFVLTGVEERAGSAYALDAFRRQGQFGEALAAALRASGFVPDSFLPEYGPCQYEATICPEEGLRAADGAVVLRELGRAIAWRGGQRASFAPMMRPEGIGNGTHIHFSLWQKGVPVTHDVTRPYGLSQRAASFIAGVLAHLPALCALSAPSVPSYYRLTPGRWAPYRADLATQDRGVAVRVAPIFRTSPEDPDRQFHVEFRVSDGTSCPYLALAAIVWAGVDGITRDLPLPKHPDRAPRLPRSLSAALTALERDGAIRSWWSPAALDAYLAYKRAEVRFVRGLSRTEICERYAAVY